VNELFSRFLLREGTVGARPSLVGVPQVRCHGKLVVGDDFVLRSRPVRSHLIVGQSGTFVVGRGVSIDHGAALSCFSEIRIGDEVKIGPFAVIMDSDFHEVADHSATGTPKPIAIGAHARLGPHVTVLRGATIGAGAVIDAGSTVSRAIPPGVRAGGVPARILGPTTAFQSRLADLGDLVPRAVMAALRLREPPQINASRKLLPAWNALAGTRIAALLEEELGVELPRDAIANAESVAEVLDCVARACTP
jgi:maltose O-acetyltransferase